MMQEDVGGEGGVWEWWRREGSKRDLDVQPYYI